VSEKASWNERLKADWISMGHEKTMAFLKARWKSKEAEKAPTKAGSKEPGSLPICSEKVQTMALEKPMSTEAQIPSMVPEKA
jgi:hypothetical protein